MRFCDNHLLVPMGEYCLECDNQFLALELSGEIGVADDLSQNSIEILREVLEVKEGA